MIDLENIVSWNDEYTFNINKDLWKEDLHSEILYRSFLDSVKYNYQLNLLKYIDINQLNVPNRPYRDIEPIPDLALSLMDYNTNFLFVIHRWENENINNVKEGTHRIEALQYLEKQRLIQGDTKVLYVESNPTDWSKCNIYKLLFPVELYNIIQDPYINTNEIITFNNNQYFLQHNINGLQLAMQFHRLFYVTLSNLKKDFMLKKEYNFDIIKWSWN